MAIKTAVNDITGALITTKGKSTTSYADNYDRIFRNKEVEPQAPPKPPVQPPRPIATLWLQEGNQLGIKLPDEIVTQLNWGIGDELELTVKDGNLILTCTP